MQKKNKLEMQASSEIASHKDFPHTKSYWSNAEIQQVQTQEEPIMGIKHNICNLSSQFF